MSGQSMTHSRAGSGVGSIVVVGGANVDLLGVAIEPLRADDSNIGHICESPGGVGRNIAENLARLGVRTHLVTAFGTDAHGCWLREQCAADGIDVTSALDVADVPGSRYLAISDATGDMRLALNDMRALDALTPAVLSSATGLLRSADVVVADTNLPAETLVWLASHVTAPLLIDPVSSVKAGRIAAVLDRVYALKLNLLEANALLGTEIPAEDDAGCVAAARTLVDAGVSRVFLTRGPRGVIAADVAETLSLPAPQVVIANATGAGDAFSAGVACATLRGLSLRRSAEIGSAMATLTLASERTVSVLVDENVLSACLEESSSC